jgi:putative endonuclease
MAKSKEAALIGEVGETFVANHLKKKGYAILARNWRIKDGEIDLVALSPNGKITFVEVKSRSSMAFGHPLEAISPDKAFRLQRLALAWLVSNSKFGADFQIDVAAVIIAPSGGIEIDYREAVL